VELDKFLRTFAKKLKISDSEIVVRCLSTIRESGELSVDIHDIRVPGGYRLEVTEYPLPNSVEGIVSLIRSALNQGGVQEFILRLGQPVRISRLVVDGDESAPTELFVIGDISADIRSLDAFVDLNVQEPSCSKLPPKEVLAVMIEGVCARGLKPRAFACHSPKALFTWLHEEVEDVMGVPIHYSLDLPEEALVLCSSPEGMDRLTHGVKFTMEGEN
jgi:hypothetical protein